MKHVLLLSAVAVIAATAACGGNNTTDEAAVVTATIGERAKPVAGGAPPDAVARNNSEEVVLAMGSSCWSASGRGACVSSLPPSARTDLPPLRLRAGDKVQFLFKFKPEQVFVELLEAEGTQLLVTELPARASSLWAVSDAAPAAAFVLIRAKAAAGSVTYVAEVESR